MAKFILKRLLMMIPVLLGVMLIVFTLTHLMPGDPVENFLSNNYTQEQYDAKEAELGLDKPFFTQFFNYVKGIVTGFDLGTSYQSKRPVKTEILERIGTTLKIGLLGTLVTVILGVPFGIISATKQYSPLDYGITTLSVCLASMPGFWLALMLIIIFSLHLKWFPASGLASWKAYILPVASLGLMPVAAVTRMTRSSMLECIRADYIRTARAKGLKEGIVIRKHALRNALIPVVTLIGMQLSVIMGGSVVIETIFTIPGLGTLMMTAINTRDYPRIQGIVLVLSMTVCVMNLVVDIVYAAIDPRIKAQLFGSGGKRRRKKEEAVENAAKA